MLFENKGRMRERKLYAQKPGIPRLPIYAAKGRVHECTVVYYCWQRCAYNIR